MAKRKKIKIKLRRENEAWTLYRSDTGKVLVDGLNGKDVEFYRRLYFEKLNNK
ncbi:hypothetical protein [Desulfatitalea tepidiphila]|uniref:hypothetical protein n=1 Tax=Desulfatitalea tepidiphila TaxID=1185843 RepID=UPI0013792F46|nr:hypothetical protein [Desulfatitalea tepidiphila]